jgi:hypothetical protein
MTEDSEKAAAISDAPTSGSDAIADSPTPKTMEQQAIEDVTDLFLRKPLYSIIHGDEDYLAAVEEILEGKAGVDYDNYCVICDQVTPWTLRKFQPRHSGGGAGLGSRYVQAYLPTIRAVNAVCLRRQHFHTYILHVTNSTVQKVGQKPSMADIALGELKAIPGIDKLDRKELGRALGLFAHDSPLGAFVYLRRVFERMIARAHERHKEKHGSFLENWQELRMGERIQALADELPSVVRSNYAVWGLLSKAIHELSDEDAEFLFPLVKAVIFEMLGEEERHRQAAIQSEATRKALASAAGRLTSKQ